MSCAVCNLDCGPLKGAAKSWACAGKLAHQTRRTNVFGKRDALRQRFDNPEKNASREVLRPDIEALVKGAKVLDLYGGGLSAEWIKGIRQDVDLYVAEYDRSLWPALRHDAKEVGYTPILGHFEKAAKYGPFDLMWLDLCGEPIAAFDAVRRAVPMLPSRPRPHFMLDYQPDIRPSAVASALYVTLMSQNRHGYAELKPEIREIAVAALLDSVCRMPTVSTVVHRYRQAGGKGAAEMWRVGPSYVDVISAIKSSVTAKGEGASYHRDHVAEFWRRQGDPGGMSYEMAPGSAHFRGTCRCPEKGYITVDEQMADRARWSDWHDKDLQAQAVAV